MRTLTASVAFAAVIAATLPAGAQTAFHQFDGTFSGQMKEQPTTSQLGNVQQACVAGRPASMTISDGVVTLSYADWGQNAIHYRGTVDSYGIVQAWHVNGDGSRSILTGQLTNAGFVGYMDRDKQACQYEVTLSPTGLVK